MLSGAAVRAAACAALFASLIVPALARADDLPGEVPAPFALDPAELDPIRFTRLRDEGPSVPMQAAESARRTELSFSLAPGRPDFSRKGAYGLGMLFGGSPRIAFDNAPPAPGRPVPDVAAGVPSALHEGLRYSAGVRIEHEDADIDGTAYVSSSLLGLSYGRLGRLWYGGIDVALEQFADERHGEEQPDILSLDVTTGRRLGITGLGAGAPLWLLSLQGDFDLLDAEADDALGREPEAAWFLNPSLFWEHPGFTFSAQMQVPVERTVTTDEEEPDYRLRAVFEKRFK